jgi:hypothetical protein
MNGGKTLIDRIEITLRGKNSFLTVYADIFNNSLSKKWLDALNHLLKYNYHLEKNYCFFGFVNGLRNGEYILEQINSSIFSINQANLGYQINDHFIIDNCITDKMIGDSVPEGRNIVNHKLNQLHRYFEDLQGVSGKMSQYFLKADPTIKWHIRQLNLLCHEFESWALSYRKELHAPAWQRPSQLMCWLRSPRFLLEKDDYELFGIETINRPIGGIFVGVNKAVGKHHWEVFVDEGKDSRVNELKTSTLRSQTEAAGDFDIEWANNPGESDWQKEKLNQFREWLLMNNFDPEDKSLTIGHPQIGQVDLLRSFGTTDYKTIWAELEKHLDVFSIKTNKFYAEYDYRWSDLDFKEKQISIISKDYDNSSRG